MANKRRGSRALSKDEDARHAASTHQPASPVLPEGRLAPGQVFGRSRRGSRYDVAEEKAVATASPAPGVRRKSITQPHGEDFCELPKRSPTTPSTPVAAPQPTSQVPARSRAGSRHDIAQINPAVPAALAVNLPRKNSALAKREDIIGIVELLPAKPISSAPRDMPQQQQPPTSRRGSKYELQANMPERQANAQAQDDAFGKRGVAAGAQRKVKGDLRYRQESQLFVTAPEQHVQNVSPQPMWPENVFVQRRSYDWHSELDDRETNTTWPCMLFTVAFLVGIVILLILFLVDSSKKLASLERTTATSPLTILATRQERKMTEWMTNA
ncbi:hypothetical protein MTO96_047039, partial [Rhipicephalus appendiculatus]